MSNTITATVSGGFDLNDRTTTRIVELGPGNRTRRRISVDSQFVHGELIVASLLNQAERQIVVRCMGSTMSNLDTKIAALLAALEQDSFSITGTINSVNFGWAGCTPADFEFGSGGMWQKFQLMQYWQELTCKVPSSPIPSAGAI